MTTCMSRCVAVFDLGKSNMKVVVFDAAGKSWPSAVVPTQRSCRDARLPYRSLPPRVPGAFLIGALKELGARISHRSDFDLGAWRGGRR